MEKSLLGRSYDNDVPPDYSPLLFYFQLIAFEDHGVLGIVIAIYKIPGVSVCGESEELSPPFPDEFPVRPFPLLGFPLLADGT